MVIKKAKRITKNYVFPELLKCYRYLYVEEHDLGYYDICARDLMTGEYKRKFGYGLTYADIHHLHTMIKKYKKRIVLLDSTPFIVKFFKKKQIKEVVDEYNFWISAIQELILKIERECPYE